MAKPAPTLYKEELPFIPYVDSKDFDPVLKERGAVYQRRMGFYPNAIKLYAHRPQIAAPLWDLNNAIMRDPSSTLPQAIKRKLSARVSRLNGCTYCATHCSSMLQRSERGDKWLNEGWGLSDEEVRDALTKKPKDEFERACFDFADAMTVNSTDIPQEIYERVERLLTPQQIVELACVVGFWKFYNTVHNGLKVPLEKHLLEHSGWITVK